MKILVVAAMQNEMKAIKNWIKSANIKSNLDIEYLCLWIWNYDTIYSLVDNVKNSTEPIFIRNIWICWYRNSENKKIIEPIQVANVINIHTEKELIVPPFVQIAPLKTCFSSEHIIYEKPLLKNDISDECNECYFDMESRGVEFVALKYKYPCLILKVPFDFIWEETRHYNGQASNNIMYDMLSNLPYHEYLEKILSWMKLQESL